MGSVTVHLPIFFWLRWPLWTWNGWDWSHSKKPLFYKYEMKNSLFSPRIQKIDRIMICIHSFSVRKKLCIKKLTSGSGFGMATQMGSIPLSSHQEVYCNSAKKCFLFNSFYKGDVCKYQISRIVNTSWNLIFTYWFVLVSAIFTFYCIIVSIFILS